MRNKLILTAAAVAAFVAFSVSVSAIPINGVITFGGLTTLSPNNADISTATKIGTWQTANANGGSGDYSFASGQVAFMSAGWTFNSGAVPFMWVVIDGIGNTWWFDQTSAVIAGQNATFLNVAAVGTLHVAGGPTVRDPVAGVFNFTTQIPPSGDGWSWSASSGSLNNFQSPDNGATLLLFGSVFLGMALFHKRFAF
jgi:hypothetical protein